MPNQHPVMGRQCANCLRQELNAFKTPGGGAIGGAYRALCARCARAVRALCEKLAVLHHREFGKFRRLEGCH